MKKSCFLHILLLAVTLIVSNSCTETEEQQEQEFVNWKETNEKFYENLYANALQRIKSGDQSWKTFSKYTLDETQALTPADHIVVKVLEEGGGSGCPLFSDTVMIHYRGMLLRSATLVYPEDPELGLVFDETYKGAFNPMTATPRKMGVGFSTSVNASGNVQSFPTIDGMTTVLMNMHIGDHWKVYIPYQQGYGRVANGKIPAYSTLVFDLRLHSYCRPGGVMQN